MQIVVLDGFTLNPGDLSWAPFQALGPCTLFDRTPADYALIGAKNCCVTPHIAWATRAARQRLLDATVANVRAFLNGEPQNVVNE